MTRLLKIKNAFGSFKGGYERGGLGRPGWTEAQNEGNRRGLNILYLYYL